MIFFIESKGSSICNLGGYGTEMRKKKVGSYYALACAKIKARDEIEVMIVTAYLGIRRVNAFLFSAIFIQQEGG